MKNEELRALRQELGLQVEWCAERVGHVSARSWKFWESGRQGRETPIPDDVQARMRALAVAIPKALEIPKLTLAAVEVVSASAGTGPAQLPEVHLAEACVACGQFGRDCLCRFG